MFIVPKFNSITMIFARSAVLIILSQLLVSEAFLQQGLPSSQVHCSISTRSTAESPLFVTSSEVDVEDSSAESSAVPYAVARGDGSKGGGGLPMPNASKEQEGLIRPKVGAEMPQGRPSWFRVPGPSQGE